MQVALGQAIFGKSFALAAEKSRAREWDQEKILQQRMLTGARLFRYNQRLAP
jgi:hypothetical protein